MKDTRKRGFLHGLNVFRRRLGTLVRQPIFIFITIGGHAAIAAGTIAFYYFERGVNPRIQSLLDTFYWAVATVTTVGYGDASPVTTGGKCIGIAMMILGSLFLWSYTALFAGGLVAPEIRMVEEKVHALEESVEGVEHEIKLDEETGFQLLKEVRALHQELARRREK